MGAFHANYHTKSGSYVHHMGIAEGGNCIILAGAGPMGLGAVDYAVNGPRKPKLLVVTDIDGAKLDRAASLITPESAAAKGVKLIYVNTANLDALSHLVGLSEGAGYDDVFVFAPVRSVVERT